MNLRKLPPHLIELAKIGTDALRAQAGQRALDAFEALTLALTPEHDDVAKTYYEKLGVAYHISGLHRRAATAFLRALDGEPTSRELSLRLLIVSLVESGRTMDAIPLTHAYLTTFGALPGGVTVVGVVELDDELRYMQSKIVPC